MGRRGPIVGAGLVALLLSGCGSADPEQGSSAEPEPPTETTGTPSMVVDEDPWLTPEGETLVMCSGQGPFFPASLVEDGGLKFSPEASADIVAGLAQMRKDFGIDAPAPLQEAEADEVPWLVLWQASSGGVDNLGLLIGEAGSTELSLEAAEYATLERPGEAWTASSWSGTCGARPALPPDLAWVQLALSDAATNQSAATAEGADSVNLLVSEIECTSARDPQPFLGEPVVVETPEAVTVYWTTEPVTGGADCPGNPWVPRTVTLEEPLADRDLRDGSTYPPAPVTVLGPDGEDVSGR